MALSFFQSRFNVPSIKFIFLLTINALWSKLTAQGIAVSKPLDISFRLSVGSTVDYHRVTFCHVHVVWSVRDLLKHRRRWQQAHNNDNDTLTASISILASCTCTVWVKNFTPCSFLNFFPNGLKFSIRILDAYYTFTFTLNYWSLFSDLQLLLYLFVSWRELYQSHRLGSECDLKMHVHESYRRQTGRFAIAWNVNFASHWSITWPTTW